jgi:DNA-binding response OmpR family regulator
MTRKEVAMASKVLLIDDAPELVQVIVERCGRVGFTMLTADTGRTAIDLAQSEHPDLIVLDPSLPDVGGIEVIRHLRQVSLAPIIILSAHTEDAERQEHLALGVVDWVIKPFRMEDLQAQIKRALTS